jgi:hypothetical protein
MRSRYWLMLIALVDAHCIVIADYHPLSNIRSAARWLLLSVTRVRVLFPPGQMLAMLLH